MSKKLLVAASAAVITLPAPLWAGENHHSHDKHGGLHFQHPLIAETPSPHTMVRLDYIYTNARGEDGEAGANISTINATAEYALNKSIGFEIGIPYTFRSPKGTEGSTDSVDNIELAVKYANHSFADHGVLIGGGLELGLPTGDSDKEIGSSNVVEIEPFINGGYQFDNFEVIGLVAFGFPQNENSAPNTDLELGWNLSFLHKTTDEISLHIEADGEHVNGGEEDGLDVVHVTPGFSYKIPQTDNMRFSAGVSFPVTTDQEFEARSIASLYYHF